ncbi:hypothetical protein EJ110_NYTH26764 [Nymphaea thermarum]|nr:hypothetical protein EJ110_NYTH26764 [Nymphaea thermarum]
MREIGSLPETNTVSHELEDEQKGSCSEFRSEKLPVIYGNQLRCLRTQDVFRLSCNYQVRIMIPESEIQVPQSQAMAMFIWRLLVKMLTRTRREFVSKLKPS